MLSQETAVGQYPVEAVAMMAAIAERTEPIAPYERVERAARAPRRAATPPTRSRTTPAQRRARAGPRRAGRARRCPAARRGWSPRTARRADLRALAGQRDGAPLRADVGRAGRLDAPPRDHRGADRRRRRARRSSSAGSSPASASASPPGCRRGRPGTTSLLQIQPRLKRTTVVDARAARRSRSSHRLGVPPIVVGQPERRRSPRRAGAAVPGVAVRPPSARLGDQQRPLAATSSRPRSRRICAGGRRRPARCSERSRVTRSRPPRAG